MVGRQLILDVGLHETFSFDNFVIGANKLVVDQLQQLIKNPAKEFSYLIYGASGCGKTHLVGAVMEQFQKLGRTCTYYPLEDWAELSSKALSEDIYSDLICLDGLSEVLGNLEWECAIFDCYNNRQINKKPMLITMRESPKLSRFWLSDLKSRLLAGLIFKLSAMNDEDRLLCLQSRAQERGMNLPASVARFLLERRSRNNRALLEALDQLDRASIEEHRVLTIPFVKQILEI